MSHWSSQARLTVCHSHRAGLSPAERSTHTHICSFQVQFTTLQVLLVLYGPLTLTYAGQITLRDAHYG